MQSFSSASRALIIAAALVIVIAGIKQAAPLTITIKLALDSKPETQRLGNILEPVEG